MARPDEDPNFYRLPPPEGRSRESTIVLDGDGHFHHDGERFEAAKMEEAFHTWIRRHPDDGRWILVNGYDWTYFTVVDTPYFVRAIVGDPRPAGTGPLLVLADGTVEPLVPESALAVRSDGALTVTAHRGSPHEGPAKFDRHAQLGLAPFLVEREDALVVETAAGVIVAPTPA